MCVVMGPATEMWGVGWAYVHIGFGVHMSMLLLAVEYKRSHNCTRSHTPSLFSSNMHPPPHLPFVRRGVRRRKLRCSTVKGH